MTSEQPQFTDLPISPKDPTPQKKGFKYKKLLASGILFTLFQVIALIIVFVASSSYSKDALEVNAAGRQRMLSQRTAKLLYQLNNAAITPDEQTKIIAELELTHRVFDKTLKAFTTGGPTVGFDWKSEIQLRKADSEQDQKTLLEAQDFWTSYGEKVAQVIESGDDYDLVAESAKLAKERNLKLLKLMNNLTVSLQNQSEARGSTLRIVQTVLLIAVIANFLFIAFKIIKQLQDNDTLNEEFAISISSKNNELTSTNEQLAAIQANLTTSNSELQNAYQSLTEASANSERRAQELAELSDDLYLMQQESNTIFDSVGNGLCLIGEDWKIGHQVSSAMYSIFETDTLAERSFLELLRQHITEKDVATLESFLGLLFQPKTSSKQLEKFNPLKSIEVTLNWDGQSFVSKHLGFDFKRIMANDEIASVLVTVMDVTDKVALENKLKRSAEGRERQTDLIMEIIQSDRKELEIFTGKTEKELDQINESLRDFGVQSNETESIQDSHTLLEDIFRKVHNIKGNSSLLGLNSATESCAKVETKLSELRDKKEITGEQFLSSLVELAYLRELLSEYDDLIHSLLKNFTLPNSGEVADQADSSPWKQLHQLSQKVATDEGKKVDLNVMSLKTDLLTEEQNEELQDVLIQLTRNAVAHGIEAPETRLARNKWAEGTIQIASSYLEASNSPLNAPTLQIRFEDDGQGLDPEKIVNKAIEKGLITESEADQLDDARKVALIFKPGFSSAKVTTEHAGHGAGMDIIREKIKKTLNGKLRLKYETGEKFMLKILIPISEEKLPIAS